MDGLEKITARISADADAEIQAIRDKAQAAGGRTAGPG